MTLQSLSLLIVSLFFMTSVNAKPERLKRLLCLSIYSKVPREKVTPIFESFFNTDRDLLTAAIDTYSAIRFGDSSKITESSSGYGDQKKYFAMARLSERLLGKDVSDFQNEFTKLFGNEAATVLTYAMAVSKHSFQEIVSENRSVHIAERAHISNLTAAHLTLLKVASGKKMEEVRRIYHSASSRYPETKVSLALAVLLSGRSIDYVQFVHDRIYDLQKQSGYDISTGILTYAAILNDLDPSTIVKIFNSFPGDRYLSKEKAILVMATFQTPILLPFLSDYPGWI